MCVWNAFTLCGSFGNEFGVITIERRKVPKKNQYLVEIEELGPVFNRIEERMDEMNWKSEDMENCDNLQYFKDLVEDMDRISEEVEALEEKIEAKGITFFD